MLDGGVKDGNKDCRNDDDCVFGVSFHFVIFHNFYLLVRLPPICSGSSSEAVSEEIRADIIRVLEKDPKGSLVGVLFPSVVLVVREDAQEGCSDGYDDCDDGSCGVF